MRVAALERPIVPPYPVNGDGITRCKADPHNRGRDVRGSLWERVSQGSPARAVHHPGIEPARKA
jgi:hypothetical protein